MKKLLLLNSLLLISIISQSQNEWKWTGNTDVTTTGILGSTDSDVIDISLRTSSSSEPVRIYGSTGAISFGSSNSLSGLRALASGINNTVDGENCVALGSLNTITSSAISGFAAGRLNTVSADFAIALGVNNVASDEGAVALGDACIASGHDAISGGESCESAGVTSISFGNAVRSLADCSITLGKGLDITNPLNNNTENSFMVGFDHTLPTLFVGGLLSSDDFGNVGIATDAPIARLHVIRDASLEEGTVSIYQTARFELEGAEGGANENNAVYINSNTPSSENPPYLQRGLYSVSFGARSNFAGEFRADASSDTGANTGLYGIADAVFNNSSTNMGVYGRGQYGATSIGVFGIAGASAAFNYGIAGTASGVNAWAGYFSGTVFASGGFTPSDESLKTNINEIGNFGMETILGLEPKIYEYNLEEYPQMNLPEGDQAGFLAQDLEQVLPSLVKTAVQPEVRDEEGNIVHEQVTFKAINYEGIIPFLVAGMQEQQNQLAEKQTQIEDLQAQITELAGLINDCCNDTRSEELEEDEEVLHLNLTSPTEEQNDQNAMDVTLTANGAILYQNNPNPTVHGKTSIRYFLPQETASAEIHFHDATGEIIRVVVLTDKGSGLINLDASEIAVGVYTYSLVINGKVVDTKKMIKS
ncbi:MAG: tail fiber domain-containing protein [Flavobacteriales bacterium]